MLEREEVLHRSAIVNVERIKELEPGTAETTG